ncbi:neurogenic locus notch homolog protein 1b [Triplophysa rosa]|uniref:Neurogenic locus notch homolog protein 1 n=1 Tax=Triplophysa rosa TaxID=992332 RepID=A0A9W7X207_TRIRA|nr:neurogenic locus notch homolog protein 1b [Triplophysa rosa]KAI7812466.1 putative neurogenic locus notch-like protein 1 [Triplophysa rosa]
MHLFLVKLILLISLVTLTQGLECSEKCLNGGTCEPTPDGRGECRCLELFAGPACQFRNPCFHSPCRNSATCRVITQVNKVDFVCNCRLGYSDRLCLTPTDNVCLSSPCRNGGTCELTSIHSYKCKCPPGWSGKNCLQADPCASNPCANGGQCSPFDSDYICHCTPFFSGQTCRQDVNECAQIPSPCKNGGVCDNEVGTYRCSCPAEYTGKLCETLYQPCNPSPCLHGGTCVQKGETSYECSCLPGFSVQNCEENIDDCPDHRCLNGGTCVDGVNTYNCQCKPEWTGQFCTEDVNECDLMPNSCQNGGTCLNTQGGYNCVCVNGWTGDDCSENIDDCADAACHAGATCHDRVASFLCECPPGRTGLLCHLNDACISNPCQKGSNCDTNPVNGKAICTCPLGYVGPACDQDVDECSLGANPCEHAGKCINTKGSFQCKCQQGFVGGRCELDVNECLSNPCQNDATCLDRIGGFHCICMPGYKGFFCQINTDECASMPCLNNGKCIDKINNYQCECPTGFSGSQCQFDIDECASTPCKNGAKCIDGPNMYTCQCTEGYTGQHCETDVDECLSNPCHYGTCKDGLASFTCFCRAGYTGRLCETNINECLSQPCQNGGTCQDRENAYLCVCPKGTAGVNCEVNIDDCKSNPCDYGRCIDKINGYECTCEPGYTGKMCNINIDDCAINPCHNGGTCVDGVNGFTCLCREGYHDTTCQSQLNECLSNPCIHGHCEDKINGYNCICDSGWSGINCDINNNECESNPCMNGGTCKDMTSGYVCTCRAGFSGPNCQTNINECASNPCLNQGTCIDDIAGYKCNCFLPYTGENCETLLAPCSPKPCKNGGVCKESEDYESFSCVCPEGWQGQTCEVDINECVKNPCRNDATCQNSIGSYKCSCKSGYAGRNCETDIDDCKPNPCSNGGFCKDGVDAFTCTCLPGFRGNRCEEDINECESNPCKNGANCTDCVNSYTCTCPPGFSGIHCENNTPDCTESSCFNGGTCVDGINSFTCLCPTGFTGNYCQHDINECDSRPCMNGGTCQDSYGTYKCTCPQGYHGHNCQELVNWCKPSPCKNGGFCRQSGTKYSCQCQTGWTGLYCDVPSVSCEVAAKQQGVEVAGLCRNSGQCLDAGNTHYCHCQAGYTGSYCEEQVNECIPNPCQNGATCTDYLGDYSCECVPGYHGVNCSMEINECLSQPCQNGGTCIDLINTYKCSCPRGTQGVHCEINIDDCTPFTDPITQEPKCFNHGRCVDRVGGYHCICLPGYVGERCEGDVNECLSNPCDPRGTHSCTQLTNNYRCECRTGYTGQRCEKVFDGCKGKPCRNGGTCAVASNTPHGFICKCPPGFTGSTCEYDAHTCGSLHCKNGGTCVSGQKSPKCLCAPAFNGPECQDPAEGHCTNNPCYNGGTCEYISEAQYHHCICPTGFNGLFCHILDYSFPGGTGRDITPAPEVTVSCEVPECFKKKANKICDSTCNNYACDWDGGDCSLNFVDPWQNCSAALQCWLYFNNGKCDEQCHNAGCLYDGFDCQRLEGQCNPLYDQYCKDHYADGHCDQGCNNAECEWDGLDCDGNVPEKLAAGVLVLVVHIMPDQLRNNSFGFLRELSRVLHTNVVFRNDGKGKLMIYPYYGNEQELRKHNIKRSLDSWADASGNVLNSVKNGIYNIVVEGGRKRRELDSMQIKGSVVYLEIDNRQCYQQTSECFQNTNDVAAFLGALASSGNLNVPYYIEAVTSRIEEPPLELYPVYVVLAGLALLAFVAVGMVASRKRRREHGQLWFPEGFKTSEPSKKKRREPVGEDSVGLRPLKNSDISLMDDNLNEWGEEETMDTKHFKSEVQAMLDLVDQTDHRQWTQQHLDAADLRIPSIAPTPPQGEIENDCMDVNVRGPDGFTPLMIASCSGGGLETGNSEEEEDTTNVINDFIYQGANLHNQTDRTGETALHLAARYARSDAAKRLLEASADANIQDNMGRTPLHAAVAADAQGVFQILIRNRATDLDARMHDGTTPLILAARLAVEGMVEELINCHADVNAVDDFGKSALHWAAAVNNVDAAVVLLKNGANKDMQNNKEETPLFLAAREGSYETAKVLLEHFANREITDHMDRLPRDIAQERMHHDIVRLVDEYNLVRSPPMHSASICTTLSPPLCSPNAFMGGMKPSTQSKKPRKPSAKGIGCKDGKDMKVKKKKNPQDGKGNLLDSSAVLSPVDSLESPHGYISDVASPPLMTSPFQQSPSMTLNQLQGISDTHMGVNHLGMTNKQDLTHMQFDPILPRLTHLPVAGSNGSSGMNGQCEWLGRIHSGMGQPNQFGVMRNTSGHQSNQHGLMTSLHNGHPAATLSQMMNYQGMQNTHLTVQPRLMQQMQQNMQQRQQQPGIQLQSSNPSGVSQNFISGDLGGPELQQGTGNSMPLHTIIPQETQLLNPSSLGPSMAGTQFLTPPSQHSYSATMDGNTPNHQLQVPEHPFLTPSPGSPDQWSSSSPHSNMSDWSEGISSPPTSMQSQMGHIPEQFK